MHRQLPELKLGQPVRVTSSMLSFEGRVGRIVQITEPYVATPRMYAEALLELPLYRVKFNDGSSFRFRGRDLEPLNPLQTSFNLKVMSEWPSGGGQREARLSCRIGQNTIPERYCLNLVPASRNVRSARFRSSCVEPRLLESFAVRLLPPLHHTGFDPFPLPASRSVWPYCAPIL